jgi:hypothetical protein
MTGLYLGRFSFSVNMRGALASGRVYAQMPALEATFTGHGTLILIPSSRLLILALWASCVPVVGDELPGDFNANGGVDFIDFSLFMEAFGSADPRFALNGSGRVDFEDLFLFADRFGEGTALERARYDSVFAARLDSTLQRVLAEAQGDTVSVLSAPPGADLTEEVAGDTAVVLPAPIATDPAEEVAGGSSEVLLASYTIEREGRRTWIFLPAYTIAIQSAAPFGIVSLQLNGQPTDFAHPELPLGDWEWFWYRQAGTSAQRSAAKLLQEDWGDPEIVEEPNRILLRYAQENTTEPGADLSVTYRLPLVGSRFEIEYTVVNGTPNLLENPYVMVGFPGFSNQGFIDEVADAVARRPVIFPYGNFQQEANNQSAAEVLLLRHDVDPTAPNGGTLEGTIRLRFGTRTYRLTTTFSPDPQSFWVYSAHTNKRRYLTSHLYAFLQNLRPGVRTHLNVEYELARE